MRAMQDQMAQLLTSHQEVQARLERMDQSQITSATNNNHENAHREVRRGRWANKYDESIDESVQTRGRKDSNLGSIKMKIPTFHGKSDPEAYLAWEKKVDFIFYCHNYSEETKVKLTTIGFICCALARWNQLVVLRRRCEEAPICIW